MQNTAANFMLKALQGSERGRIQQPRLTTIQESWYYAGFKEAPSRPRERKLSEPCLCSR